MNPLLAEFLGALFRHVLNGVAVWLVTTGILNEEQAERMVVGAIAALLILAWSLWQKFQSKRLQVTAQTMPSGSTQSQVEAKVALGNVPSAFTSKDEVPIPKTI